MSLASQVSLLATRVATEFKSVRTDLATRSVSRAVNDSPSGETLTLIKSGGVWPGSPTARTDVVIIWKGPDPSPAVVASRTVGQAGMLNGVDLRVVTT